MNLRQVSMGKDDRGNEMVLEEQPNGDIWNLYDERVAEKGTSLHTYYSRYFNDYDYRADLPFDSIPSCYGL